MRVRKNVYNPLRFDLRLIVDQRFKFDQIHHTGCLHYVYSANISKYIVHY